MNSAAHVIHRLLVAATAMESVAYVFAIKRILRDRISIAKGLKVNGIPNITVRRGGKLEIGRNCTFNSTLKSNPAGIYKVCSIFVGPGASIKLHDRVGMSGVTIYASIDISIGNNVLIGANSNIWDTDFHSLNADVRRDDIHCAFAVSRPVKIEDDVFIGANTIILKGVSIGKGAVIGAGSVVSKTIPPGEIWAGNPAKRIH